MSMRRAGFRVTWVGPERRRSGDDYGIDFRYYPLGKGRIGRLLHYRKARKMAAAVDDVNVYYAVEPDSASVATKLVEKTRAKAIFDIHEVFHDEMLARWATGFFRELLSQQVRRSILKICSRCDLVVAVSDSVMEPYLSADTPKMIVNNFALASFGNGSTANVFGSDRETITIMHGKATPNRGTSQILQAAIKAQSLLGRPIRVVMFKTGNATTDVWWQSIIDYAGQIGASDCLDLRDPIPLSEMADILRGCDIGALMYGRDFGIRGLPNRLFEYMSVGLPILGPDYGTEVLKVVEPERCGILIDCEDHDRVANAIVRLAKHPDQAREMGCRGHNAFKTRYNWDVVVRPLLEKIDQWSQKMAAT